MRYDPRLDRRRSIRLKGYDYSLSGDYFLTICTDHKRHLFGSVVEGRMCLNDAGTLVSEVWQNTPKRHSAVELDAFVLMPNHLHGIIRILAPTEPQLDRDRAAVQVDHDRDISQACKTRGLVTVRAAFVAEELL